VGVNHVTDELGTVLVDQDDVDVVPLEEPLEAVLQLADGRVFVDHHEVGVAVLVDLAHAAQEESHAGVLVADNADQFSLDCRVQSHFDGFFCIFSGSDVDSENKT